MIAPAYGLQKDREAKMTVVCATCQRYLGTKPPYHDKGVTHGTCPSCAARQRRDLSTLVVSRDRADALPVLHNIFRTQADLHLLLDRRTTERRQISLAVEVCRRGQQTDRRQTRSIRLV